MRLIKWINHSKGETPDNRGHYESTEGRFEIHPNYRHTVYPDSYTLTDKLTGKQFSDDRIRACQSHAEMIRAKELA